MQERLDGQYRKVAFALATAVRDGRLRSVVFTSPTKKQGATSTLLNVARHLKLSCSITPLVVELNRFRPALASRLELSETKSLAAIAGGKSSLDCVQQASNGLSVIPVGDFSSFGSRANVALMEGLERIQKELRGAYPLILCDAPPILEQPDVLALRDVLSNVVLIVESGRTTHEVLDRINDELKTAGISLEGTVMVKQQRPIPGWIYRWLIR